MNTDTTPPAFYFPVYGSEASQPITQEQAAADKKRMEESVRKHWNNAGVKALIEMLEREAAIGSIRAVQPVMQEHSREHQAGQGYALQQMVARIQNLRLARP